MKAASAGWVAWACMLLGWLLCAAFCLLLTTGLEAWPAAYDTIFPAAILLLFGNVLLFVFLGLRHGRSSWALMRAVLALCVAEGLLIWLLYLTGRHIIGAQGIFGLDPVSVSC